MVTSVAKDRAEVPTCAKTMLTDMAVSSAGGIAVDRKRC